MAHLTLHIGHDKTGSTAVQRALAHEAGALRAAGVVFPVPARHDNHQILWPALTGTLPDDPVQMQTLAPSVQAAWANADAALHDLETLVREHGPDHVVLSNEMAFRAWSDAELDRLASVAKSMGVTGMSALAYLRDPASYMMSVVQQDVKKRPRFRPISASRYRDALGPFVERMPVTAVAFDRATLIGGDVVADFCARVLPEETRAGVIAAAKRDNETFSAEAMAVMEAYFRGEIEAPSRWHGQRPQRVKRLVAEADRKVPGYARPRLKDGLAEVARARATDLDWLADRFGIDFTGDTGGITQDEAEARFAELTDVAHVTEVDRDRFDAIVAEVAEAGRRESGLFPRLRRLFS
ncbi:hypothetical protein [Pseudaestuariivita atlantica]|uniref:Uncharacterized protein n=1 Tax=Pseudaestuariivita atlantica TaxID=1317121 RepID=A0A0L1JRF1_9RHOB|nr:hypothetical protein [Pseudaestuariivita atlantica]KNG94379.1 hypothetical protein ATO11_09310 [Pseudaestuariivita atlantica]